MMTLLIEDDLDLAATVIDYLALEDIRCDHASNGISGLNLITSQAYDVIILDLNLPRLDGLSVCQQARQKGLDTPILMLTARDQLQDKIDGFAMGTDDYLVKPFEPEELVVRLRALSRRRSGQSRRLTYADLEMDLNAYSASRSDRPLQLSPSSWTLLETLLRAAPNPVSRQQLETALWGEDIPDSNALKVHLFNLRKQVNLSDLPALVQTIPGAGFALRTSTDQDSPGRTDS